ncbi:MAG: hypothetical protein EPO06_07290 [Burkholderiaceae bacterium]|nr:MAG: hypothetical protein EPO06_07290 [Burkholderiaceae bacterium]
MRRRKNKNFPGNWGFPKLATISIVLFTAVVISGCMVGYKSNLSITHDDSSPCPSRPKLMGWLCIVDVPEVRYLGINAYGYGPDETHVTVRFAPLNGVTTRWATNEMTIVDKRSQTVLQKVVLNTNPLLGGSSLPGITDYLAVGYGPYIETSFRMNRRVSEAQFHFPSIVVTDKEVPVPPIQLQDKMRFPVVAPIYISH